MIPKNIITGLTLEFEENVSTYDPSTDTATFNLTKSDYNFSISSIAYVAGDSVWNFKEVPATTAAWTLGQYTYALVVTGGADKYLLRKGYFEVLHSYEREFDDRSHVKKTLDAIEATLEGKATRDQSGYSISGRQIQRMSLPELLQWRDKYLSLWKREIAEAKGVSGTYNFIKAELS